MKNNFLCELKLANGGFFIVIYPHLEMDKLQLFSEKDMISVEPYNSTLAEFAPMTAAGRTKFTLNEPAFQMTQMTTVTATMASYEKTSDNLTTKKIKMSCRNMMSRWKMVRNPAKAMSSLSLQPQLKNCRLHHCSMRCGEMPV
uniref:Uncharacterized protein n=1 Tax=Romanomermis culicivorax TaxID=13658 RepID=A0A915KVJ7_ROMCU